MIKPCVYHGHSGKIGKSHEEQEAGLHETFDTHNPTKLRSTVVGSGIVSHFWNRTHGQNANIESARYTYGELRT